MADLPGTVSIPTGLPAAETAALATCLAGMADTGALGHLPPAIAPALLLGHPALADYAALMTPSHGMGMVHESQSFQRVTDLSPATPLTIQAALSEKGMARVFDFALIDGDQTPRGQMQTRLRSVTPEEMARFKGSQFPPHMDKGDVIWRQSLPFDRAAVAAYLSLARDPNPIHVSDAAARAVGLPGAVVPGMFVAGVIEPVLTATLPTVALRQMKLRFMAPVAIGEVLEYGVLTRAMDDGGRAKTVRVFVLRADRIIAAIADLEMAPPDQAT